MEEKGLIFQAGKDLSPVANRFSGRLRLGRYDGLLNSLNEFAVQSQRPPLRGLFNTFRAHLQFISRLIIGRDGARVAMTIEEMVLEKLRGFPPEKQKEVLHFVESLKPDGTKKPLRSLEGLLEDLNVNITEEEIAEARREMWGNFPREIS